MCCCGTTTITASTYVIAMMQTVFGHPPTKGFQIAEEVHLRGRAIVLTTTKEHAELKRDQIHAFGKGRSGRGLPGLDVGDD